MDRIKACEVHALMTTAGIAVLGLLLVNGAGAVTITVNASGGAMFAKIQDAINASGNGDTILVAPGIYNENVIVNRSVNLTGAGANVTIINASNPDSHAIYVTQQDGVNISGFKVTGGTGGGHAYRSAGIYLSMTNNTNVYYNIASNNFYGIYLFSAINSNISGNDMNSNSLGLYLMLSSKSIITNNTIGSNSNYGIAFSSSENSIYNNFFNNSDNFASSSSGTNIWNISRQNATNIAGGLNSGGNFWADPSGAGYSQTCMDADVDGICDFSYLMTTGNEDYLPLATPAGYINGSVRHNNTGIANAIITTNNSAPTLTDTSGSYSFRLPSGSYQLTATSEPEYYPNSSVAVTVVTGETIVQDIDLTKKPAGNITGNVSLV